MRISDWSSDVCSSDLFDGDRFFNPDGQFGTGGSKRPSPGRLVSFMLGRERAVWPEHIPVSPTVPARHIEGPQMVATWVGHRSEEHTSELQSLMRISYAVFCLKKKKKHMNSI